MTLLHNIVGEIKLTLNSLIISLLFLLPKLSISPISPALLIKKTYSFFLISGSSSLSIAVGFDKSILLNIKTLIDKN